jgi:WD40 repeat protein
LGILCIAFDGKQIAVRFPFSFQYLSHHAHTMLGQTGSADRTCRVFDVKTGECIRTFSGHEQKIFSIAMDETRVRLLYLEDLGTLSYPHLCRSLLEVRTRRFECMKTGMRESIWPHLLDTRAQSPVSNSSETFSFQDQKTRVCAFGTSPGRVLPSVEDQVAPLRKPLEIPWLHSKILSVFQKPSHPKETLWLGLSKGKVAFRHQETDLACRLDSNETANFLLGGETGTETLYRKPLITLGSQRVVWQV